LDRLWDRETNKKQANMSEGSILSLTLGLRNRASGKYLTQETFGFALNVQSAVLKKKQILTLVPAEGGAYIQTHLGRFLYGLADGKLLGDLESPNADALWTIEAREDGTWALKSRHGFYANVKGDTLSAFTKTLPEDHSGEWVVHLAMHPQINLLNVMRKRFVAYRSGELCAVEDVPWGEDALLTFVFFDEHPCGRYGLMAYTGEFLTASGKLTSNPTRECQFLLGIHDNCYSLRDESGLFLSCVGATGTLKVVKNRVTKDELFQITDSEPQFTIVDSKGKYVSVRSGVEVKADQADLQDEERFQLEIDPSGSGKVAFKSNKSTYFGVNPEGVIMATAKAKSATEYFNIEWLGNRVKFIASNGKYVTVRSNGGLVANGNGSEGTTTFTLTLINRPELVLRGPHGFVGIKGASGRVEVNKSRPDTFQLTSNDGAYALTWGGKYWSVDRDGVACTSDKPVTFFFEFVERSKFLIKHADTGKYLEGEQAGGFRATGSSANPNTLWEF